MVKPNLQLEVSHQFIRLLTSLKGSKNIYAVGDCSTMDQNYFLPSLEKIFEDADENQDGVLEIDEVVAHMKKLGTKYPALLEVSFSFYLFSPSPDPKENKRAL